MKSPFITVAIPAYNNEKTIQKTIDSCLKQDTDILYEILILDDASEDSTPEILSNYSDDKIRIVTLEKRVPLIENHNKCLQNALGEYIIFCHADDVLLEYAIATLARKIEERNFPKKYVLWGHSMFRDYSLQLRKAGFNTNQIIVGEYAALLPMHGGLTPSGTCYSRDSFIERGGFVHVDIMLAPSDITTMLHLSLDGFKFEMMDDMIFMRRDASTMTTDTKVDDFLQAYDNAYKNFIAITNENEIIKLISISLSMKEKPLYFYYSIAQDKRFIHPIKKIIIRELLQHPLQIRKKIIQRIITRILIK